MFWKKKQREVKPEPRFEPFKLKLLWADGTPETLEGVIISECAIPSLLKVIFEDKHDRMININLLKSWESIGAAPVDLTKYSR